MILAIESSCDDSSIAIMSIKDKKLLFHKKISQELEHSKYGGVVPELAARLHATALPNILKEIKEFFPRLKAVAVTTSPGLLVSLIEGISMAKMLSISLRIPIIGINHLVGHIYSLYIQKEVSFPMMILLVSGGHTMVIEANSHESLEILATTMDDSFGESFDKCAKMLGLGYPGGPIIEKLALMGDENSYSFPIPLSQSPKIAFSYSGLKNAVRLATLDNINDKENISASFQKAATAHLLQKIKKIFKQKQPKDFAIVGGASANLYLRDKFQKLCNEFSCNLHLAPLEFCSDNAAMIARVAIEEYKRENFSTLSDIEPKTKIISL